MKQPTNTTPRPGVIFDLDGTLIDTLDDITDSLNAIFAAFGYAPVARERSRALIGEGLAVLLERASGERDPARIEELVRGYRSIYRERMFERTRPYAGVPDMLDRLLECGVPMGILSNKPDDFTVPICERLLDRWPFVAVKGSITTEPRKPDPTLTLRLCERMGRAPRDAVFVGDSDIDVLTARNAGTRAIGVTWGFRDRADLQAAGPDAILETPAQVAALLLDG